MDKSTSQHKFIVSCKENLGMLDERSPITFTQNAECLPEGISLPGSVILGKSGAADKVTV